MGEASRYRAAALGDLLLPIFFLLLLPSCSLVPSPSLLREKERCDVFGKSKSGGASLVLLWGCGNTRTDMWVQGEGDTDTSQTT